MLFSLNFRVYDVGTCCLISLLKLTKQPSYLLRVLSVINLRKVKNLFNIDLTSSV